jgi:hypothetical protein
MNLMRMCKGLLAMVLAGGLMTYAPISGGQTDASSVGTADSTTGTEWDNNDSPGACESQSVDEPGQGCAKALQRLFRQG